MNKNKELHGFTLPNIAEILHSLGGATEFSTLDLKKAFHQVCLNNETKQFTAFSVGDRNYEHTRLSFGFATSSSVYEYLMSRVLQNLFGVISYYYINDIVVYSRNHSEHLLHLQKDFERLKQAQLMPKFSKKLSFIQSQIKYCGHIINIDAVTCENSFKLSQCPRPTDVKDYQ